MDLRLWKHLAVSYRVLAKDPSLGRPKKLRILFDTKLDDDYRFIVLLPVWLTDESELFKKKLPLDIQLWSARLAIKTIARYLRPVKVETH